LSIRDTKDGIEGMSMSLVLVAVSNDPDSFKDLISGKSYMEKAAKLAEINTRLILELSSHSSNGKRNVFIFICHLSAFVANKLRDQYDCLHFLYKMSPIQKRGSENKIGICQYVMSDGKFPLHFSEEIDK
jgi:hypothetical protein